MLLFTLTYVGALALSVGGLIPDDLPWSSAMLLLVPAGILLTRMLRRLPPSSLRPRPMALARCYVRFGPFVLILLANLIHVVSRASWSLNSPRRGRPSGPGPRELRVEEEFCEVRLHGPA